MAKRIALFPGSFDPFTKGHEDIVLRGLTLFDEIIIALGYNTQKSARYFEIDVMIKYIERAFEKYPNIKVLAEQTAEWDRAKGMTLMENWIQSYGNKINAVFAHNDEMGMGALQALEQAKLNDKIFVVSIDAIADALQAVKDGRLNATIFQDAKSQGAGAIEMAVKLAKKEKLDAQKVFIPFKMVTKENVQEFIVK